MASWVSPALGHRNTTRLRNSRNPPAGVRSHSSRTRSGTGPRGSTPRASPKSSQCRITSAASCSRSGTFESSQARRTFSAASRWMRPRMAVASARTRPTGMRACASWMTFTSDFSVENR